VMAATHSACDPAEGAHSACDPAEGAHSACDPAEGAHAADAHVAAPLSLSPAGQAAAGCGDQKRGSCYRW
jgi:hypothetical protein